MSTHRKRPLGRVCLMALALAALFLPAPLQQLPQVGNGADAQMPL